MMTSEQLKEFENVLGELRGIAPLVPGLKVLGGEDGGFTAIKALPNLLNAQAEQIVKLQEELDAFRRAQLSHRNSLPSRPGQVSEDCARWLGALGVASLQRQGILCKEADSARFKDRLLGISKDVLGDAQFRTALSSSDIPLPSLYSGEVVELVSLWGTARRYGTVYPLGALTTYLPKLATDTVFTLLSIATAITEKSPQTSWVTFTAEKFGGLIRLPSELDEDSIVPLGQFIARYAARNIARAEDHQFWVSTGGASGADGTAKGLTALVVDNSKTTTMTGLASPSEITLAHLRAVRAVPDAAAMRLGAYYMHPSMEQKLSALNTAGDKPYNPTAQIQGTGSQPFMTGPTLDGFPIRWIDNMTAYTTSDTVNAVLVLFGDASFHYLGVRRTPEFATSRDAAFANDEILFRATERMTVGLMAAGAMAGVRAAAA